MAPLKVLISGAGIAGPALAFWLARIGCAVTVLERSVRDRHTGQQIDIRGQGVAAMRKMGIEAAVRAHVVKEPGTLFVDGAGRHRAFFPTAITGTGDQSISSEFEIMRGDLCRILHDITKDGVVYRYGTSVEGFERLEGDEGVRVRLSNGEELTFDLVVGCDGIHSKTRHLMLGPDTPDAFRFGGSVISWVTIPAEKGDTNNFTIYIAPGRRVICTRKDRADCLRVYFLTSVYGLPKDHPLKTTLKSGDVAAQKHAWAAHFKGAGWQAERFTREFVASPLADDWYCSESGQVKLDAWSKDRVTLLGDAAYCPSPAAGQGTALALVGAYVLAGEIARHCGLDADPKGGETVNSPEMVRQGIPAALRAYETTLRPLISKVQKASEKPGGGGYPNSKLVVSLVYVVTGLVQKLGIDRLLTRIMTGSGAGWSLPEYEELEGSY